MPYGLVLAGHAHTAWIDRAELDLPAHATCRVHCMLRAQRGNAMLGHCKSSRSTLKNSRPSKNYQEQGRARTQNAHRPGSRDFISTAQRVEVSQEA